MAGLLCWAADDGQKSHSQKLARHAVRKVTLKIVPLRALHAPSTAFCAKSRGEAIREDGALPKPVIWVETAGFQVDFLCPFLLNIFGMP